MRLRAPDELGSLAGEVTHGGFSEAAAGAGDDDDLVLDTFYHDLSFTRLRAGQEFVSGTHMPSATGRRFELLRAAHALPLTNEELVGEALAPFLLILLL